MSRSPQPDATRCLEQLRAGHGSAADRLMPLVYGELRALAQNLLAQERRDHSLQATAVVHEAYLRLVDQTRAEWQDRVHFFAVAAAMLRRVLVDHARAKRAEKRGGGAARMTLAESAEIGGRGKSGIDLVELDDAVRQLAALNERQARVVELRFFAGLSVEETAQALDVSPRTVEQDWRFARAWLLARFAQG
ncbi:MAG: sigma-70 family RNA polymerase sigma factor [Phycisphaerae bacterium]|nr:sigma-70 family RNA polymerase sigma factor [Phycisphaerae bacterium]MCZ2400250.1 sigma-70 family RNA polymerase sigma factor [Phycisphaerae bacterium]